MYGRRRTCHDPKLLAVVGYGDPPVLVALPAPATLPSDRTGRAYGNWPRASWKVWTARPICLRLFEHLARAAASRTFCTAGRSRPIRTAMIAITTSNSISVNPADRRRTERCDIRPRAGGKQT